MKLDEMWEKTEEKKMVSILIAQQNMEEKLLEIHWKKQVREEMSTSTADFEKTQSPSQ